MPKRSPWRPVLVVLLAGSAAILGTVTQKRMRDAEAPALASEAKTCSGKASLAVSSEALMPWLGLSLDVSDGTVVVRDVLRAQALRDFRRGDRLTKIGDVEVSSFADVIRTVRLLEPGDRVELEAHRMNHETSVIVRSFVTVGGIEPARFARLNRRTQFHLQTTD